MSAADWSNNENLPTMVSSSDLFDGELFGDELIDIYNSTVGDNGCDDNNEIPRLLPPGTVTNVGVEKVPMDVDADDIDDGFGAFRPSTSFNDLSILLESTADVGGTPPQQGKDTSTQVTKNPKKRCASNKSSGPLAKRRSSVPKSGGRRPSLAAKKSESTLNLDPAVVAVNKTSHHTVTSQPSQPAKSGEKAADTPDPLSLTCGGGTPAETVPTSSTSLSVTVDKTETTGNSHSSNASVVSGCTEDDYKSMAQIAVPNLILNAGSCNDQSGSQDEDEFDLTNESVDTSTAHIKALTGNNWVSACSGASAIVHPVAHSLDKSNNRNRRQNLTPDERARQNRDRNREHARNTRLRKKAYVEELKRTLTELVAQRDAVESEKRQNAQREAEQREVRFRVLEEFLKLRGRNESNAARWSAILEDGFSLTLPVTDFRQVVTKADPDSTEQVLRGVKDIMVDAGNVADMLQSLGDVTKESVILQYSCDRNKFFMDGCTALMEWTGKAVGLVQQGNSAEFFVKGTIKGNFSPASNKLLAATIVFDCGRVHAQLQRFNPQEELSSHPNYVVSAAAQAAASQADAILDSLMPRLSVPSDVTVVPISSSSASEGSEKGELSSDDETGKRSSTDTRVTTRRGQRRTV